MKREASCFDKAPCMLPATATATNSRSSKWLQQHTGRSGGGCSSLFTAPDPNSFLSH